MERPTANSARTVRTYPTAPERLLPALQRTIEDLPRWTILSSEDDELRAVRTTRLLRFKDDVTVRLLPHGEGTRAEFFSASRVGRGDLGQNPRNLKELIRALDNQTT